LALSCEPVLLLSIAGHHPKRIFMGITDRLSSPPAFSIAMSQFSFGKRPEQMHQAARNLSSLPFQASQGQLQQPSRQAAALTAHCSRTVQTL